MCNVGVQRHKQRCVQLGATRQQHMETTLQNREIKHMMAEIAKMQLDNVLQSACVLTGRRNEEKKCLIAVVSATTFYGRGLAHCTHACESGQARQCWPNQGKTVGSF